MARYSLIIPAYNEASTIQHAIQATWHVLSEISSDVELLVVDDGSTDETRARVQELIPSLSPALRLITLPSNQGKGRAVQAGVLAARGEMVGFMDADLASPPEALKIGFALLKEAEIAIASRRVAHANITLPQTWYRSLAGQFFNLVLRVWLKLPYLDTQCGCKFFRREAAQRLFKDLATSGWAFDVEILSRAKKYGYRVCEFPVAWRNGPKTRVRFAHAWAIFCELRTIKHLDS